MVFVLSKLAIVLTATYLTFFENNSLVGRIVEIIATLPVNPFLMSTSVYTHFNTSSGQIKKSGSVP